MGCGGGPGSDDEGSGVDCRPEVLELYSLGGGHLEDLAVVPGGVVVSRDSGLIYVSDEGEAITLSTLAGGGVDTHEGLVYWVVREETPPESSIIRAPLEGGQAEEVASGLGWVDGLSVTEAGVFFVSSGFGGTVLRWVPHSGGEPTSLAPAPGPYGRVAADDDWVFFQNEETVRRIPAAGGESSLVVAGDGPLALTPEEVFLGRRTGPTYELVAWSRDGTSERTVAKLGSKPAAAAAADARGAYAIIGGLEDNDLEVVWANDSRATTVLKLGNACELAIDLDDDYVYAADAFFVYAIERCE